MHAAGDRSTTLGESVRQALDGLREALGRFPALSAPPAEAELDVPSDAEIAGRRVLVVGFGARRHALAYAERGAEHVLACETPEATEQSESFDVGRPATIELHPRGWDTLDPATDGTFDVVHCEGLLHRTLAPMTLLCMLRAMTSAGGLLLIESMQLADAERSELIRFVPDRHAGDATWWFVPGRLAFRWMVQTAGFEIEIELPERDGPRDEFRVVSGYLRARAAER